MIQRQLKVNDVLSKPDQKGILALCVLNRPEEKKEIRKKWEFNNFYISFSWRSNKSLWGRFGGGWQWAVGFRSSKSTLLLDCLIFSVMIVRKRRKKWEKDNET